MSIEEYADLASTGFTGGTGGDKKAPEEEFFHSVYVAGKTRKNHIDVEEVGGKFQIRGVQYNLDEVHMIITHTKEILANVKSEKGKGETTVCFSFKDGAPPWYGTTKLSDGSPRPCPSTSAERAVNDFCNPCRAQIIVAGIYCKPDGTPILTEENKPIFVFLRGKGMRYSNVSNYLNDCYQEDLDPIFTPVTDQSKEFEKSIVNNKRFVTKITKDYQTSSFGGNVAIFVLDKGSKLENDSVLSILKLSKQTLTHFNEKFDWSKKKQAVSGYGAPPEGVLSTAPDAEPDAPEEKAAEAGASGKKFSFDDVNF